MKTVLPVALSNRHCHLSQADADVLFGEGYAFKKIKDLSQPGQFACEETVQVVGSKGSLTMRILGPVRKESQVEILLADSFKLGVPVVIRDSGKLEGTPGAKIVGPKGEVTLDKGVIVASRHIHFSTKQGEEYGVKDGDIVRVKTPGERGVIFENVLARVSDVYDLEMHVDTEEGNAAGLKNGTMVEIVR